MKLIAGKILKVMASIKSISKDGFNAFHKYKYVTDAAIVSEIREKMIEQRLVCIPNQISCTVTGDLTTLAVDYTLIDADSGEMIRSISYGYGQDKGDKGVYKAATGAEKYFLLKTFLLPTDDDPEDEKEERGGVEMLNTGVRVPAGYWDLKTQAEKQTRIGQGNQARKTEKGWFIFSPKDKVEEFKESWDAVSE